MCGNNKLRSEIYFWPFQHFQLQKNQLVFFRPHETLRSKTASINYINSFFKEVPEQSEEEKNMKRFFGLVLVIISVFAMSAYADDEWEGVVRPTYDCTAYVYQTRPRCAYDEKTAIKFKIDPDYDTHIYGPYGESDTFRYVSVRGVNCDLLLFRINRDCSGISCYEEIAAEHIQDKQVLELKKPAERMRVSLVMENI